MHSVGNKRELIPDEGLLAGLCVRTLPRVAALQWPYSHDSRSE